MKRLFTSESVTEGHPDKICDQISDAILDAILEKDPYARVACETAITTGMTIVMGEISTQCNIDVQAVVRETIKKIGYTDSHYGIDGNTCAVLTTFDKQSKDIAIGVNKALEVKKKMYESTEEIGAGDQGMMFGYATNETTEFMPLPISIANKLSKRLSEVRKRNIISYLRPDGKTQVTVEYEGNIPIRIDSIVISSQHNPDISYERIKKDIVERVIKPVIPVNLLDDNTKYYINPTGRFVIGGPQGDSGLTGRKIIVDTYGGIGKHGGGAFSGKDPTKVDRSGAYAARWVAKNLVAAGIADKIEVQLAYAIGVAKPVSISVDTFGTGKIEEERIIQVINEVFDLRLSVIIEELDLRNPIYFKTSVYGHFGRSDITFKWEETNKVEQIKKYLANR